MKQDLTDQSQAWTPSICPKTSPRGATDHTEGQKIGEMETDGKKGGLRYKRDVECNGVGEGETTRGKLSLKICFFHQDFAN